jgi:hypothetical protein
VTAPCGEDVESRLGDEIRDAEGDAVEVYESVSELRDRLDETPLR